jgi:hypothetical protein
MSDLNGIGVPDLGAIRQRQREKEQVPRYAVGTPEFACPVGVQVVNGVISFRDALDKAAVLLDADGFTIEEIKQCAFAGVDQNGAAVFQVVVRVSETHAPS